MLLDLKKNIDLNFGDKNNEKNSILHFRFYFLCFLFNCNHVRLFNSIIRGEYIMRIPTNSNFTKEMSKRLQRIINPQTTLEELQNLQEEVNMINPVDTYLQKQVSHLEKNNEPKTNVQGSRTTRQEKTNGERFVTKVVKEQGTAEEFGF